MRSLSIAATLRAAVLYYADQIAFVDRNRTYTFNGMAQIADELGESLRTQCDVAPSDRVAVIMETGGEYIAAWWAALFGWFIIAPLNTRLAAREIASILRDCGATVALVDEVHEATIRGLGLEGLRVVRTDQLIAAANGGRPSAYPSPEEDAIAAIVYTGGSTGCPKGVAFSQRTCLLSGFRLNTLWCLTAPRTRLYGTTPLFHVSGFNAIFGAPLAGAVTILARKFDVEQLMADVADHQVTHVSLVPTMLDWLVQHPDFRHESLSSLRVISYGGSPVSTVTLERLQATLPAVEIIQVYGLTEVCGGLTLLSGLDHREGGERLKTIGRALVGVSLQIRAPTGVEVLPYGQPGEIFVRTDALMEGYWRTGEEIDTRDAGEWFGTGDIGICDQDGYITLIDRLKDMIISGGENVYSAEVERVIQRVPGVLQVAVVGAANEKWGEQVCAIVHAAPFVQEAHILEACRRELARYKCPKLVELRAASLPMTGANKIDKVRLRSELQNTARESRHAS